MATRCACHVASAGEPGVMGHTRLGDLPRTRRWGEVVGLLACGASTAQVANATMDAAERGLNLAAEENVVLTTTDGRQFVVAEIDDFEAEVCLVRENRELMEFLRQRSAPGKTYTLDEVRKELRLT